ncbi:MAG: tetratricopeptide repeat protein [Methylobacter sp.]
MAVYDVYIKGIRPDRMDEAEQIKKKASQVFKIEEQQLEALWSTPTGLCIRRGISGEEAEQVQVTLSKAGLVCLYRPGGSGLNISLVEKTEEKALTKREFSCPYCEVKTPLDEGEPDPIKCPECSGIIAKYAETMERKEIRDRLLNSKLAAEKREMQISREEAEKRRKKEIEEEIAQEIFGKKSKTPSKNLLIAGGVAIAVVSGASYFMSNGNQDANVTAGTAAPAGAAATAATGGEAAAVAGPEAPADAQMALQDVHDKANNVLGAFGLDADNLGKNAGKAGASSSGTKLVSTAPSAVPGNPEKPIPPAEQNTAPAPTVTLLQDGGNNQEWDLFLNQRITKLIEGNNVADAFKLSQYLIDTEDYINAMGKLLAQAQLSNQDKPINDITAAIDARINALPVPNQVEYLAQAGLYQFKITKKTDWFTRAETAWKQLQNPDDQLKSALKIAVYNFKAGNVDTANNYFGQADGLLAKNTAADKQASARAAIGRAYFDVNDSANAFKWLASAEQLIPEVTPATLKELVGSYAYIGQAPTAALQTIAKEKQGELLYRAVQVSLKSNAADRAASISNDIQDSSYKALADDLVSSYQPDAAATALDSAEKQLQAINLPTDKAIVASRLSRHYARIGNAQKASELLKTVEQQFSGLPESSTKDEAISLIVRNFAQSLQFDTADNLTIFIQSPAVKSSVNNEINRIKEISALLSK